MPQVPAAAQAAHAARDVDVQPIAACRGPRPVANLGSVDAFGVRAANSFDDPAFQPLLEVCTRCLQRGNAVDGIDREIGAIQLALYRQLERRVDVALFLVSVHMEVGVVGAPIGELVDQCERPGLRRSQHAPPTRFTPCMSSSSYDRTGERRIRQRGWWDDYSVSAAEEHWFRAEARTITISEDDDDNFQHVCEQARRTHL